MGVVVLLDRVVEVVLGMVMEILDRVVVSVVVVVDDSNR